MPSLSLLTGGWTASKAVSLFPIVLVQVVVLRPVGVKRITRINE